MVQKRQKFIDSSILNYDALSCPFVSRLKMPNCACTSKTNKRTSLPGSGLVYKCNSAILLHVGLQVQYGICLVVLMSIMKKQLSWADSFIGLGKSIPYKIVCIYFLPGS